MDAIKIIAIVSIISAGLFLLTGTFAESGGFNNPRKEALPETIKTICTIGFLICIIIVLICLAIKNPL